jgi:uncharacterized protein YjbI with pentapeptide repeats
VDDDSSRQIFKYHLTKWNKNESYSSENGLENAGDCRVCPPSPDFFHLSLNPVHRRYAARSNRAMCDTFKEKNMKRILVMITIASCLMMVTAVLSRAEDRPDLDRLLKTKECMRCNLDGVVLRGADLNGANLKESRLNGADLSGANLSGADLTWTEMNDIKLTRADLSNADLAMSIMRRAAMDEANLNGASLRGADLTSADLRKANLRNIKRLGMWIRKADLTGATWVDGRVCAPDSISVCR